MVQEPAGAPGLRRDLEAVLATAHDEGRLFPHAGLVLEHASLTSKQAPVYVAVVERLTLPGDLAGRTRGRMSFSQGYDWDGRNEMAVDLVATIGSGTARRTEFLARALRDVSSLYPPDARPTGELVVIFHDHDAVEKRFQVFAPDAEDRDPTGA